jgi:H+/Cl- antiporter ClcA
MTGTYPPPAASPARDRTELWGWLGIVFGICCGLVGVVFGVLSLQEARKHGRSPVLGWVAIGVSVLTLLTNTILVASDNYPGR